MAAKISFQSNLEFTGSLLESVCVWRGVLSAPLLQPQTAIKRVGISRGLTPLSDGLDLLRWLLSNLLLKNIFNIYDTPVYDLKPVSSQSLFHRFSSKHIASNLI